MFNKYLPKLFHSVILLASGLILFLHVCVAFYYLGIVPATSLFYYIVVGLVCEPHHYIWSISPFSAVLLLHLSFYIPNLKTRSQLFHSIYSTFLKMKLFTPDFRTVNVRVSFHY
jgi:hypothetical protein